MTVEEFSDQFDTLVDSYRRFKDLDRKEELDSIEFNEYEKSVYLTKALEQLVVGLYNGKLFGESFEKTEQIRRSLDKLVKSATLLSVDLDYTDNISDNSRVFSLPESLELDVMFIIYESIKLWDSSNKCSMNGKVIEVVPVSHDEYHRIKNNPFRGANGRRALRLDVDGKLEIISKYPFSEYYFRYLSRPKPIILVDLPLELTINGENKKSSCILNPAIHGTILELAVKLALLSRSLQTNK